MSNTTNYNLKTWATGETSDSFNNFLFGVAGDTNSNMTKIDTQMKTSSDAINVVKSYPIKTVTATKISDSYYTATISDYSAYVSGNIFVLLLDYTSSDTLTININSIGTVSVMKYDLSGSLSNVIAGEIVANYPTLIRYDGTRWVVIGHGLAGQILTTSGNSIQYELDRRIQTISITSPTSINGILKGNGSVVSAASDTSDYASPSKMFYPNNQYGSVLSTNLDTISLSGFYVCAYDATGSPFADSSAFIIHENLYNGTTSAKQTATALTDGRRLNRIKISSTWSSWLKLPASDVSSTLGTVQSDINALYSASWNTYTHSLTSTTHALTGTGIYIKFIATGNFTNGDTFTVNGSAYTLVGAPDGFKTGDIVFATINSTNIIFITHRPLLLWSGSISSGTITVPNWDRYRTASIGIGTRNFIGMITDNGALGICGVVPTSNSSDQTIYAASFTSSGNDVTLGGENRMVHTGSGSHDEASSMIISNIWGIVAK